MYEPTNGSSAQGDVLLKTHKRGVSKCGRSQTRVCLWAHLHQIFFFSRPMLRHWKWVWKPLNKRMACVHVIWYGIIVGQENEGPCFSGAPKWEVFRPQNSPSMSPRFILLISCVSYCFNDTSAWGCWQCYKPWGPRISLYLTSMLLIEQSPSTSTRGIFFQDAMLQRAVKSN
jgi:hypothetical protein